METRRLGEWEAGGAGRRPDRAARATGRSASPSASAADTVAGVPASFACIAGHRVGHLVPCSLPLGVLAGGRAGTTGVIQRPVRVRRFVAGEGKEGGHVNR
jgi:hypothetical protein